MVYQSGILYQDVRNYNTYIYQTTTDDFEWIPMRRLANTKFDEQEVNSVRKRSVLIHIFACRSLGKQNPLFAIIVRGAVEFDVA